MRPARRHLLTNRFAVLSFVAGAGTLACWLGCGIDSVASAVPPETPAQPAQPSITISRGRDAASPTTAASTQATTAPVPAVARAATRPTSRPAEGPTDGPTVFGLAREHMAAGDLVAAREVLNDALIAGKLSGTETLEAKKQIAEMSKTLVFSGRRLPGDPWIISHMVEPGEVLAKLGSMNGLTASFLQQINNVTDARKLRAGYSIKIVKGPFYAVVTKHAFTMDLYLGAPGGAGSMYVTTYRVGLGTDDSTPTGTWVVEPGKKLPHPTYYPPAGQGPVIEAEDPKNPLGKYWIGLKGVDGQSVGRLSYGIHGTIEPESIGKQASLGCIRLLNQDVAQAFGLLVEGKSTVVVLP